MKKIKTISKYLPLVSAIILLWIGVISFANINISVNSKNKNFIPKNTNFIFHLHLKNFAKNAIYSLIFETKDQELLDKFKILIQRQKKDQLINELGIDYFSEFTFFGEKYKNNQVFVFSFILSDKDKFNKNFDSYFKDYAHNSIDDIGFIALSNSNKLNKNELDKYLKNLKINKQNKEKKHENVLFDIKLNKLKINDNIKITDSYIYSKFNDKSLSFNGKIYLEKSFARPRKWTLNEEFDLHPFMIESFIFTDELADSLRSAFSKSGFYCPKIIGISLNYYGLDIQDDEAGLIFTPRFDMILHFKNKIEDNELYFDYNKLKKLGFDYDGEKLLAGKIQYTIEKLDDRTLFFGFNKNTVIKRNNYNLFKISGAPNKLTEINGGGFISSMINIIPEYKATKSIFNSVDKCEIKITPKNNRLLFIRGEITLLDNYFLYNEILKFYLTINGIF